MRACEGCSRDFAVARGGTMTCPFCGYNNVPGGYPRSLASVRHIEQRQLARQARQLQAREDSYD